MPEIYGAMKVRSVSSEPTTRKNMLVANLSSRWLGRKDADVAPPHSPQLNGTAERLNKSITFIISCLLIDLGLPASTWIFAAEAAIHVYNRMPNKSIYHQILLNVFAPGRKLHLDKFRRFGCVSYVKVPKPKSKFAPKAIQVVLVGYYTHGYIFWHPPTNKFVNSKQAQFNEKPTYKDEYSKTGVRKDVRVGKTTQATMIQLRLHSKD